MIFWSSHNDPENLVEYIEDLRNNNLAIKMIETNKIDIGGISSLFLVYPFFQIKGFEKLA